jgi:hypothetical protein
VAICGERAGAAVETVESRRRPEPQGPRSIFVYCYHDIAAQAARIGWIVAVPREALSTAIEGVHAGPGTNPQRAVAVFVDVLDEIATDAVRVGRVVAIRDHAVAVVAVEPVVRTEPHEADAILRKRLNALIRQPVRNGDVRECGLSAEDWSRGCGAGRCLHEDRSVHTGADDNHQRRQKPVT